MSYLSGIYRKLLFSWLGGVVQKTVKSEENRLKKNIEKWKRKKKEEYKEQ